MHATSSNWEDRLADLWSRIDSCDEATFAQAMAGLNAELSESNPIGLFELGAACDSTGSPQQAVELYKSALAAGLSGVRRRRVQIQMASLLRNLGEPQRAADMLFAEMLQPSDELDQAVSAFMALALADLSRDREALSLSLGALSNYRPRYNRSLARYAHDLAPAPI